MSYSLFINNSYIYIYTHTLLLRGFSCWESSFFGLKNASTPLSLSRDKAKGQCGKYTTLTLTKIFPKKYGHFLVEFQIVLSTYKLDSQNKNYIYIYIYNTKHRVFIFIYFLFFYKISLIARAKCVR